LLVRALTPVNANLLEGSRVKFVATATIGVNHVDRRYLQEKGIGFASAPGANADAVADYIVAALLSLANKHNVQLKGKSIGIIGVGRIGSRVEKRVRALDMKVCLNDPPLQNKTGDEKYRSLGEINKCDFITLHTPLTVGGVDKTLHLADANFFNSLKNKTFFINASRSEVVDSEALKEAIDRGILIGTIIDVWENEPHIDTQLLNMVDIATPHIAGLSIDGRAGGMFMAYEAICKYSGIKNSKNLSDFLPTTDVPVLELVDQSGNDQEIFSNIVQRVYNIEEDDNTMRKILNMSASKQGVYFDQIRDNYPNRRDFHNTQIIIEHSSDPLATKFKGIGFNIRKS